MTGRIDLVPLPANRALRAHWSVRRNEAAKWHYALLEQWGRNRNPAPQERQRLELILYVHKLQDPDNAVASCKPAIDAFVKTGWLRDDSQDCVEVVVRQGLIHSSELPFTLFQLTPIP